MFAVGILVKGIIQDQFAFIGMKKKILNFNDLEPAKKKCKDPSGKFLANNLSAENNESLMTLAEVASVYNSSSVASKVQWDN